MGLRHNKNSPSIYFGISVQKNSTTLGPFSLSFFLSIWADRFWFDFWKIERNTKEFKWSTSSSRQKDYYRRMASWLVEDKCDQIWWNYNHFGKILKVWTFLEGLLSICHNIELSLANLWCYWANFNLCKWSNVKQFTNLAIWSHCVRRGPTL